MRKQRDRHHSPSANTDSDSSPDVGGAQGQSVVTDQSQSRSMQKDIDAGAPGGSASGLSRFGDSNVSEILQQNQAMRAEIERLQAQLDEPPPGYPGYADDSRRFTSSAAAPIVVS
ncbi:hypothetical protein C0992_003721 [Termitomyces sp. T32_za158]|nr:hypothetical protein C0992_003721 [Termitomyces sp. T32_za158]